MVMTVSDAGEKPAPAAAEVTEVAGTAAAEQLAAVAAEPAGEAQVSARPSRSKRWVTAFSVIAPMGALFWLLTHQDQLLAAFRACRRAEVGWTLLAIAAAAMTYVAAAASLKGSVTRRLPFGQLIAVQVAGILPNQVLPAGVGIAAVQARYLRRSGLPMADAVASTAVNATVGMIPHALVLVVLIAAGHAPLPRGAAEQMTSVLPLVAAGLGLMALLAAVVPAGRRLARTAARHIVSQRRLLTGAGSRSRFALLWGGSAAIPLLHAACLCAVMAALNARFDPLQVVVIYLVASAAAALIPSPGGFGSLDAALTALLTGAAGAATTTAIAAVLGYRLLTAWLPMAPSAAVCGVMIRARLL
ncbi:MAG: flippase-like domain-containing protein [Frankia sp.]|nr:flippase-like domain-containing protein [Frankia sp.]